MTPRCDMCRHWKRDPNMDQYGPLDIEPKPYDTWDARRRQRNERLGICEAAIFGDAVPYEADVPAMVVMDGSGYQASLSTRDDHACAEFEDKDTLPVGLAPSESTGPESAHATGINGVHQD